MQDISLALSLSIVLKRFVWLEPNFYEVKTASVNGLDINVFSFWKYRQTFDLQRICTAVKRFYLVDKACAWFYTGNYFF